MTKRQKILQPILMSLGMAAWMGFVMTAAHTGFTPALWTEWLKAFPLGFVASLPPSYLLPPLIQNWMDKLGV